MRVGSQPIILRHFNKKMYTEINNNENDPIKNKIEEIYNSIYEDNFFFILTISKTSFLNRIDSKAKEITDTLFNQNNSTNIINYIKIIKIDIIQKYTEDYTILYQAYKNIKNKINHYNYLTNFRKHCEETGEYAYHSCINNKLEKLYEIKDNNNIIKYALCPLCKYCFLSKCIRLVCNNCNKEYFSSTLPENQDKNILLATWEKYHCGSMKNQNMKCIKCRKDLYIDLTTNKLVCLNKSCNFTTKPLSILWKCSKCGKDFRSKPKIFNPTELEIIQKAINITLLIKKKAYPKELPCCHRNPEKLNFYHKEECRGILYMGILLDREIVVCDKCHAMNFEEKFTWICPKCSVKFHLHQLTSIKPFKVRKYIINRDVSILSKRNNKSNINIRNLKNEVSQEYNIKNLKIDSYCNSDAYQSIQPDNNSLYRNTKNNDNYERVEYPFNYEYEKKIIFSDNERSNSNEINFGKYKKIDSISIEEERFKKEDMSDNNSQNYQNISIGKQKLDYNKNQKKGKHYRTLLDILEKRKQKESIIKSGRHLTNSEFSFNDLNSINNNYDRISTGITNREGTGTYNKNTRNIANNILSKKDPKWQIISEINENNANDDDNFIYKKKTNITSYKKVKNNEKSCRINDYKSQVVLLQDKQKKDRNISDIDLNQKLNMNKNDEDKIVPLFNAKNNSITTNSYIFDNDSLSKKSINNSYKNTKNQDLQYSRLNNSSVNIIENKIYRYNNRNSKKNIINNNLNISNIPSINSEKQSIKSVNKVFSDDSTSNKVKVGEYQRKYKRNSRIKNTEDISKDKSNNNDHSDNYSKMSDNNNNNNNNYLIYQNTKNYFLKFTLPTSTPNNNERKSKKDEKEEILLASNEKPIKVSRIYQNKIVDRNKNLLEIVDNKIKNINLNDNVKKYNFDNRKQNNKSQIQQMKVKNNIDKYSMNNIIATPDKINDISKKCIIPSFQDSDYKYIRPIGEGSYGMIYLVKNVKTNKEYALKKILCKNLNEIIKHKNQLELIYSMKHHNIMKIYYLQFKYLDLTTYSLYIIMERAIGDWSLDIRKRILTKKYYKEYEIINILKQVVSALVYLEERKIAHRDVKPQNILIFPGKIYKVADLGEAKNIENINREITLRGSELYMSPLVYQRHKLNKKGLIHNVFKSDVFSLGFSTLYAICLDLNVIEDIREMTDMKKIVNNIDKYFNRKLFSDRLYRLIINMIEIDENKRYSFKEIERELQKW